MRAAAAARSRRPGGECARGLSVASAREAALAGRVTRSSRHDGSMYRLDMVHREGPTPGGRVGRQAWEGGPRMLEFAILGLLHEAPMHGYELRKRLHALLGQAAGDLLRFALPDAAADAARRADRRARPGAGQRRAGADRTPRQRSSTRSRPRGRSGSPSCWPRPVRRPGRTRASASTSPSSPRPAPTSGCGSWRAGGGGSRGGARGCAPRWPAPASGSTATPSSCSSTASSRSTARSAGCTS